MRIGQRHLPLRLRTDRVPAGLSPCNEELLLRSEAVEIRRPWLSFQRLQVRQISKLHAAQVADAFSQDQLTIVVRTIISGVSVKLLRHARAPLLETFVICISPPLLQFAGGVVLRALIVKTVRDLVTDHRTNGPIIHRVGCVHVE